jgi:hypothetical protein
MQNLPIEEYLDTRGRLFEWTVALHNAVNASTGKPQQTPEEMYEVLRQEVHSSASLKKHSINLVAIVALVVVAALLIALFARYKRTRV